MKKLFATCLTLLGLELSAGVTPGQWNDNFTDSLAYAEANGIPIVVVWGNQSCSYCNKLHAVLGGDMVMDWAAEHPIVMVSKHDPYGSTDADYLAARDWIKGLNKSLGSFPFVGVSWKTTDGEVKCSEAFPGREGKMYVKTPKGSLAGQFVNSLDALVGDYEPAESDGISFVTTDTEDDRLEAEPSTRVVYVPLKRESGRRDAVCFLNVAYPTGAGPSIRVEWEAGELSKNVAVAVPVANFQVGKSISLLLTAEDGSELGRSSILLVEAQENAPKNPYWVGEYTAASLPYGEWTMDFDVAKEKVARFGGKLMVMFGGPLWCPNCVAIEDYVFAEPEFKAWAKAQKIVLVHFDQGQASSPSTPEGTSRGRLLTTTPSTKGKSGASYLSRHGIEPGSDAVNAVIDRVTYLTDAWLAPETTAARLANPVVLLLNDAGTKVEARFQRQSAGYTMDLQENMCRFKDLLLLAGANENEGYRTVTPLEAEADEEVSATLQINASKKYYKLTGLEAGYGVEITAKAATNVTLTLYAGKDVLATGMDMLTVTEPFTSAQLEDLSVCVSAFASAQSTFFGANTTFAFDLSVKAVEAKAVPFSGFTKTELKEMNPMLCQRRTATIPMLENISLGGKRLAGTLLLSISAANKVTAKFVAGKTTSFSGFWQEISPSTGLVSAEFVAKGGATLLLTMDAEGTIEAKYEDGLDLAANGRAALEDMTDYVGRYTVTLVDIEGDDGTASLAISVAKTGKASVSGVMPDGTTLSASVMLAANGDGTALLPLYVSSRKGVLSTVLSIDADASDTWGEEGMTDTVHTLTGCPATWTDANGEETSFNVFGGYWEKGATTLEVCDLYDLSERLAVTVSGGTNAWVKATKSGFKLESKDFLTSLSFNKTTGVFSGKAKVLLDSGKTTTATIKGVLMPGWIDCGCIEGKVVVERPFGSGTLTYKVGKDIFSAPLDLVAESAE